MKRVRSSQDGFGLVEIIIACALLGIIVVGLVNGYNVLRRSYALSRQLNEMYAVLSACPEMDRALEYDSISSSANCYPNNTFQAEGGTGTLLTYAPQLTITPTASLASTDALQPVPDAKVINISVGYLRGTAPPLELRMLISRNGIGQQ